MRVGQRRKRDQNESEIVRALRQIGVTVERISEPGLPDLLTHARGIWLPIEVKMPGEALTPAQAETYQRAPFAIVHNEAEALALFGVRG